MLDDQPTKRVALTIHALYGGGAERLMSQLANRWAAKYEIHLITWSEVATDQYELQPAVVRHGLGLMRQSTNFLQAFTANRRRVHALRETLRELSPDFILSFSDQMNIVAIQASKSMQAPIWISEHSDPRKQHLGFRWEGWRRLTYPRCTGCVVLTDDIAAYMADLVPKSRIRVIPPSIPTPSTAANAGVNKVGHNVLFVGRLSHEKRVDLLIQSWLEIAPQLPGWELKLVGDGPRRPALENQALGHPSVKFLGWVTDPIEHYQLADLFVLTSNYEGFPVALLEAMSYGIPCIATRCSSAIEQLNTPQPCIVDVATDSQQELSRAIRDMAGDHSGRTRLGELCRQSALRYQWETIGPEWDALLEN